ncbi:hypothetical protein Pelo_6649 [Pelomyxa schiedti]|nr:hypothetical protein Pelo_6649 [Pelomyxa schiedti]
MLHKDRWRGFLLRTESFENVTLWLHEIVNSCTTVPPIILVGTKLDMATHNLFWETSSKDGTNVEGAIMSLLTSIERMRSAHNQVHCWAD